MQPGVIEIFQCPHCQCNLNRSTLASGNTFGAILYSDGKLVAPMLPEVPIFSLCAHCKGYFWVQDAEQIGEADPWYSVESSTNPFIELLSLQEYIVAFDVLPHMDQDQLKYLIVRIWWGFNDRVREGQPLFENSKESLVFVANLNELLKLLGDDAEDMLMKSEIHRQLKNFSKASKLASMIENSRLASHKQRMLNEIQKNSAALFWF